MPTFLIIHGVIININEINNVCEEERLNKVDGKPELGLIVYYINHNVTEMQGVTLELFQNELRKVIEEAM